MLSLNSTGWQTFDVTVPVRLLLGSAHSVQLLGLRIEIKRPGSDDFRPVRWRRMRRMHMQPFIAVFTDDGFSMEEDIEHNYLHAPTLATAAPRGGDLNTAKAATPSVASGSWSMRVRRSLADNRLPPTAEDYYKYDVTGSEDNHVAVLRHYSEAEPKTEDRFSSERDNR